MSVFRKAMVYLGLVDDDEYYGDDGEYYEDDAYEDAPERPSARRSTRTRPRPRRAATSEPSPVTVIRSRRDREEPHRAAPPPRPSAVKPVPMPAARVHVMEPKGSTTPRRSATGSRPGNPSSSTCKASTETSNAG